MRRSLSWRRMMHGKPCDVAILDTRMGASALVVLVQAGRLSSLDGGACAETYRPVDVYSCLWA